MCSCEGVCVVTVIVKRPVLPPCVVDGCDRNPLYYYYLYMGASVYIIYIYIYIWKYVFM